MSAIANWPLKPRITLFYSTYLSIYLFHLPLVYFSLGHRRSGTFGLEGTVTLLPKKVTQCPKVIFVLYKPTQIAVKTKTFTILTSDERISIPKLQLNPDFSKHQGKRKLVRKIGYFEMSGVTEITMFD